MGTMRSETAGANTRDCAWQNCRRCNGYMEREMCIDLESDNGSSTCWVLRCLQCGDIVDETILQHRSLLRHDRSSDHRRSYDQMSPEAHVLHV